VMIAAIAVVFAWGFSKRKVAEVETDAIEAAPVEMIVEPQEVPSEVP
jgi:hypothetical protein